MKTSLKAGFAQIFSCCPKNLSCPKFGGAAAPLAPPARTPMHATCHSANSFPLLSSPNSEVFVDVWLSLDKSIDEFSMVYKKMSALIWLRVYNHDFGL